VGPSLLARTGSARRSPLGWLPDDDACERRSRDLRPRPLRDQRPWDRGPHPCSVGGVFASARRWRTIRLGSRVAAGVAIALLIVAAGGPVGASIGPEPTSPPNLVERHPCSGAWPASSAVPASSAATGSAGDAAVSFVVAPTVRVLVSNGHPIAAMTNTGCAPQSGDAFVVDTLPAPPEIRAAALRCSTSGDWTQSRWVQLTC